ncbi:class I SAM-dependent methyltransferase [Trichothermofontia sichuanensis B231]|uniref:class I SAM-dependent methyltransferase n=1 Tax=Trichothermofontia sichuanensis TaxID=3045816 RepID=UPI0022461742|nr:class I SAM-dependent methyltransferase [Trichothermofontia sichuanensis]UZQ53862.1 class I SAM-dependent methyltransferase [Trichothermofontia sichuanensis B231]
MPRQDTIFERFLAPFFRTFLIDEPALRRLKAEINWPQETQRFERVDLTYPDYYRTAAFHGIAGGYLTADAAVTYDPITQHVLPPGEAIVRQALIDAIRVKSPQRILDLGCGTGSMTLLLKQTFPDAEVVGVDLSPYMLVMADRKAQQAQQTITWLHADAAHTGLNPQSFDLVTAALLFHETPPAITQAILREGYRLLKVGGEFLILDGNQQTLRLTPWLMDIFEEPYIRDYADGSLDADMGRFGFGAVQTTPFWWMHQVTRGVKPIMTTSGYANDVAAWTPGDRKLEKEHGPGDWVPVPI